MAPRSLKTLAVKSVIALTLTLPGREALVATTGMVL
jgi:preprotein translocase subunit SecD